MTVMVKRFVLTPHQLLMSYVEEKLTLSECFKRHDAIDAVPLFEHTLCVNTVFACKYYRLDHFSTSDSEK